GGVEKSETVEQAFYREMNEELGFEVADFADILISKKTYVYDFPVNSKKVDDRFIGQEQAFVLARLVLPKNPVLNYEFRSFVWLYPQYFQYLNYSFFKKGVAYNALKDFGIL